MGSFLLSDISIIPPPVEKLLWVSKMSHTKNAQPQFDTDNASPSFNFWTYNGPLSVGVTNSLLSDVLMRSKETSVVFFFQSPQFCQARGEQIL